MSSTLLSLFAGVCIGGAAAYLGSLMLSRRMALVAGPLGHLTLPGIALALLWGFDISLGAFPFVVAGAVLIWWFEKKTRLPMEALTALVFSAGVAIAFLLLPVEQAEAALVGDISKVTAGGALLSVVASGATFLAVRRMYPKLVLANMSEELAAAEGINVSRYDLGYLLLIAVIVALGVRMVGGLLTAALVAIPASAARSVSKNLRQYALGATVIGATSAGAGVLLAVATGLAAGPLVIIVSATIFLALMPFAK